MRIADVLMNSISVLEKHDNHHDDFLPFDCICLNLCFFFKLYLSKDLSFHDSKLLHVIIFYHLDYLSFCLLANSFKCILFYRTRLNTLFLWRLQDTPFQIASALKWPKSFQTIISKEYKNSNYSHRFYIVPFLSFLSSSLFVIFFHFTSFARNQMQ